MKNPALCFFWGVDLFLIGGMTLSKSAARKIECAIRTGFVPARGLSRADFRRARRDRCRAMKLIGQIHELDARLDFNRGGKI